MRTLPAAVAKDIGVPLLIMNAADDPIAQYNVKEGVFDAETLAANPNLVAADDGGPFRLVRFADRCAPTRRARRRNVVLL